MNKIEEIAMSPIRGFTLVEVMIVLAIVMILTTLAYPGYAEYITKTRRIEGQIALMEAIQQQERYFMRNNGYLAFSAASTEPAERQFRAWSGASAARSAYEMEGRACPGQAITDCIEVRATPGTQQVDSGFKDPACGVLTLDSVGRRSASGTSANCWP
jgi:type IV pilus assembly protein PilE